MHFLSRNILYESTGMIMKFGNVGRNCMLLLLCQVHTFIFLCVCVSVRVCVRARARACVCVCVCVSVWFELLFFLMIIMPYTALSDQLNQTVVLIIKKKKKNREEVEGDPKRRGIAGPTNRNGKENIQSSLAVESSLINIDV